jgi:hypothetical protein
VVRPGRNPRRTSNEKENVPKTVFSLDWSDWHMVTNNDNALKRFQKRKVEVRDDCPCYGLHFGGKTNYCLASNTKCEPSQGCHDILDGKRKLGDNLHYFEVF